MYNNFPDAFGISKERYAEIGKMVDDFMGEAMRNGDKTDKEFNKVLADLSKDCIDNKLQNKPECVLFGMMFIDNLLRSRRDPLEEVLSAIIVNCGESK